MRKKCEICAKEFYPKPYHVKMGWGKFCSSKCHYLSMRKGVFVFCGQCKKKIYRNDTQLRKSKSNKFFCGKSCQTKWRNRFFSGNKHSNWIDGKASYRKILLNTKVVQICERCLKTDTRILIVHHIDKNRKNNDASNLMWLCINCHFLVHHDNVERSKFIKINKL